MAAADPRSEMLRQMAECAYRIGMAFGAEAERAQDTASRVKWWELFERCFFSVRVSTALELRLKQDARREPREAASDREELIERPDPADHPERPEAPERYGERYTERDRDREVERASFPILLRTLQGIAADAAALPGPPPAALVTLQELLAKVKSQPQAAAVPRTPATSLRAKLTGSGAASALALAPRPPSTPSTAPAIRRATGPPPR